MGYFIFGGIIWGIIWGFTARAVIINKGYDDESAKWFWLGFFFAFIPVIIAATKPSNYQYHSASINETSSVPQTENKQPQADEWRCSCGRVHKDYIWSCPCGKNKSDIKKESQQQPSKTDDSNKKKDDMTIIREYKSLLDEGIITQEEFESKKKQLLGL